MTNYVLEVIPLRLKRYDTASASKPSLNAFQSSSFGDCSGCQVVSPRLSDVDVSLGNGPDFGRPINSMPRETSILQNRGSTRVLKIFLKEYRGERFSPRSIGRSGKWSLRYSCIYPNVRLLLARPLMYQDRYWFIGDDGKCIVRPSFGVFHRWSQHRFCGAQVLCLIWSYMGFACSWWLSCRCCQKYVQYP